MLGTSLVNGKTVIVSSLAGDVTQTIFGTSSITQTTGGVVGGPGSRSANKGAGGLGVAAGVGIGVGLTAALGLLGALAFFFFSRRRKQRSIEEQEMNSIMTGAADDDDRASTITTSEADSVEKVELDGTNVRIVSSGPVELLGDIPIRQEIDGRIAKSPVVSPIDRQNSQSVGSQSMRRRSSIVSPLSTSDSERDAHWPLAPPEKGVT